jgi:lysine-arginine-ornithine-binding protein
LLPAVAQAQPLRIGTSADAPPWESVDATGKLVGFDIDLGNEICTRIKRECQFTNQAFDGLLPALLVKKFDALMTSMAITEKRKESVNFTRPYAPIVIRLVAAKTFPDRAIDTVATLVNRLEGKVIGCQRGSTQEAMLKAHFPKSTIRTYARIDEIIADLKAGRIDVASLNGANWQRQLVGELAEKYDYLGPKLSGDIFKELGEGYGIALRKDDVELQTQLNGAIESIFADGTADKLAEKWLGFNLSFK